MHLTKADDEVPSKRREQCVKLLIAEAPVREDRDRDVDGNRTVQALDELVLEVVPSRLQGRLRHRHPRERRRSSVPGHDVRAQRSVVVLLEVGPVERDDDFFTVGDDEPGPGRSQRCNVDCAIAQESIDLLHSVARLRPRHLGVPLADRVDAQRRRAEHAGHAIRDRENPSGVQVPGKECLDELLRRDSVELRSARHCHTRPLTLRSEEGQSSRESLGETRGSLRSRPATSTVAARGRAHTPSTLRSTLSGPHRGARSARSRGDDVRGR